MKLEQYLKLASGIMFVILFLIAIYLNQKEHKVKKDDGKFDLTKYIARVGIFGAISTILYTIPFLKFAIPGFPSFLEVHFDEIPAFIAGFAYGPLTGFGVIVLKTLIKLPISNTIMVGELSDLVFSTAFILPATIIYKENRKIQGALIGLGVGFVVQVLVATILNVYVSIPFYVEFYGIPLDVLLKAYKDNPISDIKWAYALIAVVPFNLIKNAIVVVITMLIYKPLRKLIEKAKQTRL